MQHFPFGYNQMNSQALLAGSYSASNNIQNTAGYGYTLNKSELNQKLKIYKNNGGIPELLHDASMSVNYNGVINTEFDTNTNNWNAYVNGGSATLPLISAVNGEIKIEPQGTYTFAGISQSGIQLEAGQSYVLTGKVRGSLPSWQFAFYHSALNNPSGTVTKNNQTTDFSFTYTSTSTNPETLFLRSSTPGLDAFYITNIQLAKVATTYRQRRGATTVKSLNIGTAGASGDAQYVNGNNMNMLAVDATSGLTNILSTASSQGQVTSYIPNINTLTFMGWVKPTDIKNQVLFWNNQTGANRLSLQLMNNGKLGVYNNNTVAIAGGNSYVINQWQHVALVKNGNQHDLFLNGGSVLSSVISSTAVAGLGLVMGADTSNADYINGNIDMLSAHNIALTLTQIQNIFNAQRTKYGR